MLMHSDDFKSFVVISALVLTRWQKLALHFHNIGKSLNVRQHESPRGGFKLSAGVIQCRSFVHARFDWAMCVLCVTGSNCDECVLLFSSNSNNCETTDSYRFLSFTCCFSTHFVIPPNISTDARFLLSDSQIAIGRSVRQYTIIKCE